MYIVCTAALWNRILCSNTKQLIFWKAVSMIRFYWSFWIVIADFRCLDRFFFSRPTVRRWPLYMRYIVLEYGKNIYMRTKRGSSLGQVLREVYVNSRVSGFILHLQWGIFNYIHTCIIGHYEPSVRITREARSHSHHLCCVR